MSQHHDRTEEKGSRVGKSLASDIWCGSVDSLEDGAFVTDVTRWSKTKTSNKTSAHIGENVTVQVGHNQNFVVVWCWVGDDLQAGVIEELGVEFDLGEVLRNSLGGGQEKTITHLHDGSLVNRANLKLSDVLCVLECESKNTLTGLSGNELDALHNTIHHNVLNAGVLSLGVFSDKDSVNSVVWGLVACN
jgi:hypothetical protein